METPGDAASSFIAEAKMTRRFSRAEKSETGVALAANVRQLEACTAAASKSDDEFDLSTVGACIRVTLVLTTCIEKGRFLDIVYVLENLLRSEARGNLRKIAAGSLGKVVFTLSKSNIYNVAPLAKELVAHWRSLIPRVK